MVVLQGQAVGLLGGDNHGLGVGERGDIEIGDVFLAEAEQLGQVDAGEHLVVLRLHEREAVGGELRLGLEHVDFRNLAAIEQGAAA